MPNGAVAELVFRHEIGAAEHSCPFAGHAEVGSRVIEAATIGSLELDALATDGQRAMLDTQRNRVIDFVADSRISVRVLNEFAAVVAGYAGRSIRRARDAFGGHLRLN